MSTEQASASADDRWLEGWNARRDATLEDLAAGYRSAYDDGRGDRAPVIFALSVCSLIAFVLGFVICAAIR